MELLELTWNLHALGTFMVLIASALCLLGKLKYFWYAVLVVYTLWKLAEWSVTWWVWRKLLR